MKPRIRDRPQHPHVVILCLVIWSYDATFGDTDASLGFACFRPFGGEIQKLLASPAQHKASPLSRSCEVGPLFVFSGNSYWLRQPTIGLRLFPSVRRRDSEALGFASPAQRFASFQFFEALFSSSCQPSKLLCVFLCILL